MLITSRSNPAVVAAAALHDKKYRDEQHLFLFEGIKLFREAVLSGIDIVSVFTSEKNLPFCREMLPGKDIIQVSDSVIEKLSTEKSPQGVICVAKYIDKIHNLNKIYTMKDFISRDRRIMILSSLRDPGNLGTVIRTASAFGTDELILSADCADIYNPKTVRAAMGTLFRQRITYAANLRDAVIMMTKAGYNVCAAVLDRESERLDKMKITSKTAFVIGNEGHGISPDIIEAAGSKVYIPMEDGVESLNAAAAAAVFMWQMKISVL